MTRRAALVADVAGWAFDVNLRALAKYSLSGWQVEYFYVAEMRSSDWLNLKGFDAVFTPYHRWSIPPGAVPSQRHLGSLRCEWFYPERSLGVREGIAPTPADIDLVNRHAAFHVVTRGTYNALERHCPGVRYLTNPVDTSVFHDPTETRELVCEWNGNPGHGGARDVKGLPMLRAACEAAGLPLRTAEYCKQQLRNFEMPAFYRRASIALCGSLYEGASNSVMEAMAMGLALVSTDCGNVREMQDSQRKHFGDTGIIIVERNVDAFTTALRTLMPERVRVMGKINALEIASRWSWNVWEDRYTQFFKEVRP